LVDSYSNAGNYQPERPAYLLCPSGRLPGTHECFHVWIDAADFAGEFSQTGKIKSKKEPHYTD
jgi:hypothetical protein